MRRNYPHDVCVTPELSDLSQSSLGARAHLVPNLQRSPRCSLSLRGINHSDCDSITVAHQSTTDLQNSVKSMLLVVFMNDTWWEDEQSDGSSQKGLKTPPKDTGTMILKANKAQGNFLMFMVISMFASGFITNPVSEMELFPQENVFYYSLFALLFLACFIILSSIWGRLDKQWTSITVDDDGAYLQRHLPLKINSYSHKQIKPETIDVVIMEKVFVEIRNDDDDIGYNSSNRDGYWDYRVEMLDKNNKTLAFFSLESEGWRTFATRLSERLEKQLIEEK